MKYYLIVGEASGDLHASHLMSALKTADPQADPCPYLRRYIIVDRYLRLCMNKFGNIKVEPRIIHQNYDIRIPSNNVFFATFHICKDSAQMKQYRNILPNLFMQRRKYRSTIIYLLRYGHGRSIASRISNVM